MTNTAITIDTNLFAMKLDRTTALRAARQYGLMGDKPTNARIGAMILGYWSLSPTANGPVTIEAIHEQAFQSGLYSLRTLSECFALGRGMAVGYKNGERHGAKEIITWVAQSTSIEEAQKVDGWIPNRVMDTANT